VDQFDTFGLGKNVPIAAGNANESLPALVDGRFVNLPHPLSLPTRVGVIDTAIHPFGIKSHRIGNAWRGDVRGRTTERP
jgi:hypothetical protein